MAFRSRCIGSLLSIAGILGMSLVVVSPASAAPAPDPSASTRYSGSIKPNTATDVQPMANCNITSRFGNRGQYICGTFPVGVESHLGGAVAFADLVIGIDNYVYVDSYVCPTATSPCNISGWGRLQNGIASSTAPVQDRGLAVLPTSGGVYVLVLGTDNRAYCNLFTFPPYRWSGWSPC
jgi:hypothetical protein